MSTGANRSGRAGHRGVADAGSPDASLRKTLDEIVALLRRLYDLSGCAFLVVDWEARRIRPAAAWFASPAVRTALGAVLTRPYDPRRPGITEAAIERDAPLVIARIETWAGADALRARLAEQASAWDARVIWEWYRSSSLLSCPVHAPDARPLGVLALASTAPSRPFDEGDLRQVEVFADLAGIALDRAELLAREQERSREELAMNRAVQKVARSLELDDVYRVIVEEAARLSGAEKVALTRQEPASHDLRVVHQIGFSERIASARFVVGEGMIGRVAETGRPYVSRAADEARFLPWATAGEGVRSFAHVPLSLGPRLFGVLTIADPASGPCDEALLERLVAFARAAAGSIANALDFQREQRVARALTRGFVPGPLPLLEDFDAGLVYEPAGRVAGGGDVFGIWPLREGALAVLVGDVSGKGIEVAAISSMVRFFVEARAYDAADPARVLAETDRLLRGRLPGGAFVPAVLAVFDEERVTWCNAGHPAPVVLRSDGSEAPLERTGLPLGVELGTDYRAASAPFRRGDVLVACTDGLLEARRDGRQFGDERLPALLAQHGRALAPAALVERLHAEAQAFSPSLDDDVVVLALRRR